MTDVGQSLPLFSATVAQHLAMACLMVAVEERSAIAFNLFRIETTSSQQEESERDVPAASLSDADRGINNPLIALSLDVEVVLQPRLQWFPRRC